MNFNAGNALSLHEMIDMLNADQRRVFDKIKRHLLHQKKHEDKQCQQDDYKPLTMFVSGVGGTGKSFLIEAIKALVSSLWSSDDLLCAVTAPTGLAAFNVGGITIHRLFQLPIQHPGEASGYWRISKDAQKTMKTSLRSLKMIIIDEVSMVSSLNLAYIHLRLQEVFGGYDIFGSRNILFVGDLLQLPPVKAEPVFETISKKEVVLKLNGLTAINFWRDSVVYDELTINERQRNDQEFSKMLDCVRRGSPTEETLSTLAKRVIDVSPVDKFEELRLSGHNPVCLFPRREECNDFNRKMLDRLPSEVKEIVCVDEIDQTRTTCTWTKQLDKKLEILNKDCNMTGGLESKISLAVGARVMLRRNIDTKAGLVNGALGTVNKIAPTYMRVQFDHDPLLHDIEMVKGKFMIQRNFYGYRQQFPLILAYAVTIHKCQGLSLDCAIIDLNKHVFSPGMAYVALSRVRSLAGLHLISFTPSSIVASPACIQEINHLRAAYRSDLPSYDLPTTKRGRKCSKLTGCFGEPDAKKPKTDDGPSKSKRPNEGKTSSAKKSKTVDSEDLIITGVDPVINAYKFYTVNEQWQRNACARLGLQFVRVSKMRPGGPNVTLTPPDRRTIKHIVGDGNCLFRCFSYMITGSEDQHTAVRMVILEHMISIAHFLLGQHIAYDSVQDYIAGTGMDQDRTYGSDVEMFTLAHLLLTPVYSYNTADNSWWRYAPSGVDRSLVSDNTQMGMYLLFMSASEHFEVVCSVRK